MKYLREIWLVNKHIMIKEKNRVGMRLIMFWMILTSKGKRLLPLNVTLHDLVLRLYRKKSSWKNKICCYTVDNLKTFILNWKKRNKKVFGFCIQKKEKNKKEKEIWVFKRKHSKGQEQVVLGQRPQSPRSVCVVSNSPWWSVVVLRLCQQLEHRGCGPGPKTYSDLLWTLCTVSGTSC